MRDRDVGLAIARGVYEPNLLAVMESFIKPGMTSIDAGANLGLMSLVMAKRALPGGRVYAFEPFPKVYHLLQQNIEENGLRGVIVPYRLALHRNAGTAKIYYFDGVSQTNYGTMFIPARDGAPVTAGHRGVDVELARADDVIPPGERISIVKIDVEGSEPHVLEGMQRIIAESRPILFVEFNPYCLRNMGDTEPEKLLEWLEDHDNRIFDVDDYARGETIPFRYSGASEPPLLNLICFPRG